MINQPESGYKREIVHKEAPYFRRQASLVLATIGPILQETALVERRPFTLDDVESCKRAFVTVAPFFPPELDSRFIGHVSASGTMARMLAEQSPELGIDPLEAQCLMMIGDIGRLVSNRYLLNDAFAKWLGQKMSFRRDLIDKLPPIPGILGVHKLGSTLEIKSIEDLQPDQLTLDWVDNFAKLSLDGKSLRSIKEWQAHVANQSRRYAETAWPLEAEGVHALTSGKQDLAIRLVGEETRMLQDEYGIDLEKLRKDATQEFFGPENQAFMSQVNCARETLDPKIDEALKRSPIKKVVFDIGNVLWEDADPVLISALSAHFRRPENEVLDVINALHEEGFAGKASEREYLERFWEALGQEAPNDLEKARAPLIHPEIYHPVEGMQDLVERLLRNPASEVYLLSNIITPLTGVVSEMLKKYYPGIDSDHILYSCFVGASKKDPTGELYKRVHGKLGDPLEAGEVLHIDDVPSYMDSVRRNTNQRGFTFVEDPSQNLTRTQRLEEELRKANLIG